MSTCPNGFTEGAEEEKQMLRINDTGAREILAWLNEYSNLGYITPDMLSAWCEKAEQDGHIELRSYWSKDRTVRTYMVSDEGVDIEEVEVE